MSKRSKYDLGNEIDMIFDRAIEKVHGDISRAAEEESDIFSKLIANQEGNVNLWISSNLYLATSRRLEKMYKQDKVKDFMKGIGKADA